MKLSVLLFAIATVFAVPALTCGVFNGLSLLALVFAGLAIATVIQAERRP